MDIPSEDGDRMPAADAAIAFARSQAVDIVALILAGSVVRRDAGASSDLDLIIVADGVKPLWSTHVEQEWPIECFRHSPQSLAAAFEREVERRWPLLLRMGVEGELLLDRDGAGAAIQARARQLLAAGPAPLTAGEIDWYRYNLTWMLDDVAEATDAAEAALMAHDLVVTTIEAMLHARRAWLGKGKWLIRNLREVDPEAAARMTAAQERFFHAGDRGPLLALAREVLEGMGGRKFAGQTGNW
jgi:predicted nucleotidyltransferase